MPKFQDIVSSCVWAPDGQSFVTGCLDKQLNLAQWSLNGELIYDWGREHRIQDLAVSPNGHRLVAVDCENHIHVYNFVTRELEYQMDLEVWLRSVNISQDSRFLLVNKRDGKTRMLDLDTRETVRDFDTKDKAGNFVIRSTFGGANESFVISGSEGMSRSTKTCSLADQSCRRQHIHLSQGERNTGRAAQRSRKRLLYIGIMEPYESLHVRISGGRWQGQDVSLDSHIFG